MAAADEANSRVQILTVTGELVRTFGKTAGPDEKEQLSGLGAGYPHALGCSAVSGHLFVVDRNNAGVQVRIFFGKLLPFE